MSNGHDQDPRRGRRLVDVSNQLPTRQPEIRPYEPSPVEDFVRALVTTAAEYLNLGQRPIQSPRRRRERMQARVEAGNLIAEPEDYEGSFAEGAGETVGHFVPSLLTRGVAGPAMVPLSVARGLSNPPPGPGRNAPLAGLGLAETDEERRMRLLGLRRRAPFIESETKPDRRYR